MSQISYSFGQLLRVSYICEAGASSAAYTDTADVHNQVTVVSPGSYCPTPNGYEFLLWDCGDGFGSSPGDTLTLTSSNTVCTAVWREDCPNSGSWMSILTDITNLPYSQNGQPSQSEGYSYSSGVVEFVNYGLMSIEGKCSEDTGGLFAPGDPGFTDPSTGLYCWCHMISFTTAGAGGGITNVGGYSQWIKNPHDLPSNYSSGSACDATCTADCAEHTGVTPLMRKSLYESCGYKLEYDCNNGTGNVVNGGDHVANSTVNLVNGANGCSAPNNNLPFSGWVCHASGSNTTLNPGFASSLTMPFDMVVCEARWGTNLTYHNCSQGGSFHNPNSIQVSNPTHQQLASSCVPDVVGVASPYAFGGWYCVDSGGNSNVVNSSNSWIYDLSNDTNCYAIWNNDSPCNPGQESADSPELLGMTGIDLNDMGADWNGVILNDLFHPTSSNQNNLPEIEFNNGAWTVTLGDGLCSSSAGIPHQAGYPVTNPSGDFCWCQIKGANGDDLPNYPWVFSGISTPNCTTQWCQNVCADLISSLTGHHDPDDTFFNSLFTKTICEYTINFNCNNIGATGYSSVAQTSSDTYVGGQQNVPMYDMCVAPNGYSFGGWNCSTVTSPTTTYPTMAENGSIGSMPYDNVNCIANWTQIPTYTVTYDCNNGDSNQSNMIDAHGPYYAGTSVQEWYSNNDPILPMVGNCDVPVGNVFLSWTCTYNNGNDGVYESYDQSTGIVTMTIPSDNVNCTASWGQLYPLQFDCGEINGTAVSGSSPATTYHGWNETINLTGITPTTNGGTCAPGAGWTFSCWDCHYTTGNDTTSSINNCGTTVSTWSYGATCVAQWTPTTYNVTYDCTSHGGSNDPNLVNPASYSPGASVPYPKNHNGFCIPPSGATGAGWWCYANSIPNSDPNSNWGNWYAGDPDYFTMPSSDVTCTAAYDYSVSYTCGSFSGSVSPAANSGYYRTGTPNISLTSASNVDTSGCVGTSGYSFNGWNCHGSGLSNQVNSGYIISNMPAYSVICDAQWTPIHTLVYDCSGCGVSSQDTPASVPIWENMSPVILPNSCFSGVSADYDFVGWNCFPTATGEAPQLFDGGGTYNVNNSNNVNTTCYGLCVDNAPCGPYGNVSYQILGKDMEEGYDANTSMSGIYWYGDAPDGMTIDELWNTSADNPAYSGSNHVPFVVSVGQGSYYVDLNSSCTNNPGAPAVADNPGNASGPYCWCQVDSVYYPDDPTEQKQLSGYPWVFALGYSNNIDCTSGCLDRCISWLQDPHNPSGTSSGTMTLQEWFLHSLYTKAMCNVNLSWVLDQNASWPQNNTLSNQTTCTWGEGAITPLYQPTKPGHTFNGWKVTNWTQQ